MTKSSKSAAPDVKIEGDGAPDSLELRLERIKRLGNLELDFLKRLYDRRPVRELYEEGSYDLHVHAVADGERICIRLKADRTAYGNVGLCRSQPSMLVWVGNVLQGCRPVVSTIRLQPLDSCFVRGVHSAEPSSLHPSREVTVSAFDGKLCHREIEAGIEAGETEHKIVEGSAEIVANVSNDSAHPRRDIRCFEVGICASPPFKLHLDWGATIDLDGADDSFKLINVIACPAYPLPRPIQRRFARKWTEILRSRWPWRKITSKK
jgi:hypothetical protein